MTNKLQMCRCTKFHKLKRVLKVFFALPSSLRSKILPIAVRLYVKRKLSLVLEKMAAMKPQSKREEFRRYLEKAGVMDALTRVLVGLYEEPDKPSNAIEYFLDRLGAGVPLKAEVETLQTEVSDLQRKIQELEEENSRLRKRLGSSFQGSQGGSAGVGAVELEEDPTTWSEGAEQE